MNPAPAIKLPVGFEYTPLQTEASALIETISRAASDPNVDINKLERLIALRREIGAEEAEKMFNRSMTACQLDIRQIATDAENLQTRSKYATYAKLDSVLRPNYTKHGFALSFGEDVCEKPDTVRVTCIVSHVGGHSRKYHRDIPADGKGAKGGDVMTKTHAAGAAGSYGARYLLKGIFNVAIGEYDNDGNDDVRMNENEYAVHLKAIDAASDEKSLMSAFGKAWKSAEQDNDIRAMRRFGEHKEARKKALGLK
jgi:hypothetical protein